MWTSSRSSAAASPSRRSICPTCWPRAQGLDDGVAYKDKAAKLHAYASFGAVPAGPMDNLVRLGVVLDAIVDEFQLDAYAIRCWLELQNDLGISPCVVLGELSDRGVAGACEVDIGNAVVMRAFELASDGQRPAGLEQQLRRRGRPLHPLPLRKRCREPHERAGARVTDRLKTPSGRDAGSAATAAGSAPPMARSPSAAP